MMFALKLLENYESSRRMATFKVKFIYFDFCVPNKSANWFYSDTLSFIFHGQTFDCTENCVLITLISVVNRATKGVL